MHHGVKGMKWGVRKQRPPKGGIRGRYHGTRAKMYRNSVKAVGNDAKSVKRYSAELRREGFSESEIRDSVKGLKKVQNNSLQKAKQHEAKQQEYINRQTNSSKGLSSKQKETLKKIAIGAAVVAGVGLATYGGVKIGQNIKLNKKAMSLIDDTIRKNARETISDYIHTSNKSINRAMNSADIAKLAGDKTTMNNYVKSANSIERDVANIKKNANRIIEDRVKSVPMKEKKAEARKLVKELKSVDKRNEAMRKAFNKGKISKYSPQETEYVTPTKWVMRRYPDWDMYRR